MKHTFYALTLILLSGCASTLQTNELYTSYEAKTSRNFTELGQCIREKDWGSGLGKLRLLDKQVSATQMVVRPTSTLNNGVHLTQVNNLTNIEVYGQYNKLHNKFPGNNKYVDYIQACTGGDLRDEKYYDSPLKQYSGLDAPRPDNLDLSNPRAMLDQTLESFRTRDKPNDYLIIEKALDGEFQPLQIFYTEEAFSWDLPSKNQMVTGGSTVPMLFYHTIIPYNKDIYLEDYTLFCSTYGESQELFKKDKPTDERVITLWHDETIIDTAIVPKDHPFMKKCETGTKLDR